MLRSWDWSEQPDQIDGDTEGCAQPEHKYYARDVRTVLTIDQRPAAAKELLSITQVPAAQAGRSGQAPLGSSYCTRRRGGRLSSS